MRGLIRLNFWAGAAALAVVPVLWVMNGLEVTTAVVLAYAIGVGLLLVSAGLWWNRRLTMNRAYAEAERRTVSNNYLRRQLRGRRNRAKPFLEPLGVNKGLRTYRPELVEGVENVRPPGLRASRPQELGLRQVFTDGDRGHEASDRGKANSLSGPLL